MAARRAVRPGGRDSVAGRRRPRGAGRRRSAVPDRRGRRLGRRPRSRLAASRTHSRRHRHGPLRRAAPRPGARQPSCGAVRSQVAAARQRGHRRRGRRARPCLRHTARLRLAPRGRPAAADGARPCPASAHADRRASSARWRARSAVVPSASCSPARPPTARSGSPPSRPRAASPSPRIRRAPSTTACRSPRSPPTRSTSSSPRARSPPSSSASRATPTWLLRSPATRRPRRPAPCRVSTLRSSRCSGRPSASTSPTTSSTR